MKKGSVKAKKIKPNKDFIKIFNQMVGLEDVPSDQISFKYEKLKEDCKKFIGSWEIFRNSTIIQTNVRPEFSSVLAEIDNFCLKANEELEALTILPEKEKETTEFNSTLEEALFNIAGKYDSVKLNKAYRDLKKSKVVEQILITYERLKTSLYSYKDKKKMIIHCLLGPKLEYLSNKFIIESETDGKLLGFSNLDFKFLYNCFPEDKKLNDIILVTLHFSYTRGEDIYKTYISPDINVKSFVSSFVTRLEDLKKTIPNCDAAFDLIKKSAKLLESNFDDYYKQFIATKNPGIIFEGFLTDVAKNTNSSLTVKNQIGKIISQIKSQLTKQGKMTKEAESLSNYAEEILKNLDN